MDERTLIVARLNTVRKDLNDVLGRLNDKMLPWAPREGMRSTGDQLVEIFGTELQCVAKLKGEPELSWATIDTTVAEPDSLVYLRSRLEESRAATLVYIESLTEAQIKAPAIIPPDWFESMGLPQVPVGEVLRWIAQHEWYHTGQLVSYLWFRGDNPYAW
ncbi:MAG: DinB family protein [Verrucomicrobiaceae bacterium]|nr:MAG: DinB family protein [Verrucomicrobiaceae bacterium]